MSNIDEEPALLEGIRVIEFHMMDTKKYYLYIMISSLGIRWLLYPFNLVKTRLQIQKEKELYTGTFNALWSIQKTEGMRGLYRGVLVNSFQLIPAMFYITSYERTRSYVKDRVTWGQTWLPSFAGGALASLISQSIVVPIDIITQHIMLISDSKKQTSEKRFPGQNAEAKLRSMQKIHISKEQSQKRFGAVSAVTSHVYKETGVRGFYKGYWVSLGVYVPNSALWWTFYHKYSDELMRILPDSVPRLPILWVSAPLAGISAATLTNPLDVIRARMQVNNQPFMRTVQTLWKEEKHKFWIKGMMPRLMHTSLTSFLYMLGYETVKKMSLLDEYKDKVRL